MMFTATKVIPKLDNVAGYGVWRPLMEHYLMERKLYDILKMKIDNWKFISDQVDQYTNKSNEEMYKKFGISLRESVKTPQIKTEKVDESLMNLGKLSGDELKQLSLLVQRVRTVYSILYEAIPIDVRGQIGSEHYGDGAYLWKWLEDQLQSNTIDAQHEIIGELFTLQQSENELFQAYKARVDVLNDRLAQAKVDLPPAMYRYIVLKKLRLEYRQIVVAIDLSSEYKDVDGDSVALWNKIALAITRFERSEIRRDIDSEGSETAMMTRRGGGELNGKKYVNKKNIRCFKCQHMGHYANECIQVSEGPGVSQKEIRCITCQQLGHYAPDCQEDTEKFNTEHANMIKAYESDEDVRNIKYAF